MNAANNNNNNFSSVVLNKNDKVHDGDPGDPSEEAKVEDEEDEKPATAIYPKDPDDNSSSASWSNLHSPTDSILSPVSRQM